MYYFSDPQLDQMLAISKLVIFDMNGLIVDDEGIQLEAVNKVLSKYHISLDENYWIEKCVGHRDIEMFESILKEFGIKNADDSAVFKKQKNYFYKLLMHEKLPTIVRPGIIDLVKYLSKSDAHKIAVATSASTEEVEIILGGLKIKDKFDLILCGDHVKKPKPDPEIYLAVSKRCNISPADCLVFEDSSIGIESASNAGMVSCAIPNKYTQKQDFSRANFVIDNLTSSAKILNKN